MQSCASALAARDSHCKAPISSILEATYCEDVSPGGIESRQIAGTLPQLESTLEYELLALVRWAAERCWLTCQG